MLTALDHVNICTNDPEETADWYTRILGLQRGHRPAIPFPGIWLYIGDTAVIHLVSVQHSFSCETPSLEHFAFRAEGMDAFEKKLETMKIPFDKRNVPGTTITQFNITDPMGNHLHVDFRDGK